MKKLIFLGTNSVLERYIEACERQGQEIAGIIDSDWFGNRESFAGLPILDSQSIFETDPDKYRNDYVFFIGTNWNAFYRGRDVEKRRMFINLIRQHNLTCVNLIDPTSYVSRFAKLGQGVFIGAGCSIEPNVIIEDFAVLWGKNGIGHDSRIGENTIVQRDAGMHAIVGNNTYIGIATYIIRDGSITIGNNVVIAPCLHVARDVADNEHVTLSKEMVRIYRHMGASK